MMRSASTSVVTITGWPLTQHEKCINKCGDYNRVAIDTTLHKHAYTIPSRKHLRTKVTPDFHLTYSKNGGNQGSE